MAAQLLIGRYTGYRLSELFRFRDFLKGSEGKNGDVVARIHKLPAPHFTRNLKAKRP
jgi:hypothetical protein